MSRKLQSFFGNLSTSVLFQVFGFFGVFYALRWGLAALIGFLLPLGGFSTAESHQIVENNEIFIQTLCLLASLWVVFRKRNSDTKRFLLQELLGESEWRWPRKRVWLLSGFGPSEWILAN